MKIASALKGLVIALGLVAQPLLAHGSMLPKHGGIVQMTGETLFELAATPKGVALYVEEEDEPVDAKAMTAKLAITVGAKKQEVVMAPQAGNAFFAKGLKLPKGARVSVQVVDNASKARNGATFLIK